MKPFIITIDTEGDNLWSRPKNITTENAKYLPRFQELCERFNFKPVYLTNWEMVNCEYFVEFAKDVIRRNTGEIGMHLHAWNSPPLNPLYSNDFERQPFLIEYSEEIIRQKIDYLTKKLEDTFNLDIVSHRSGRWAIDNTYLRILKEFNYKVDCSITPKVDWMKQDEQYRLNNVDYVSGRSKSYFVGDDIMEEGQSDFLEVPMTIMEFSDKKLLREISKFNRFTHRALEYKFPTINWLRPNGRNLNRMKMILDTLKKDESEYAEFMIHSSEFMPGGSPYFKTKGNVEKLFEDIERLYTHAQKSFVGMTLKEFYINKTLNYVRE